MPVVAAIAVGAGVVGAVESHREGKKAASRAGEAAALQRRQAEIQNQIARNQAIARAQSMRASVTAQAAMMGADSSAAMGASASTQTQLATGLGNQLQQEALTGQVIQRQQSAGEHSGKADTWGMVSSLAFKAAGSFAGDATSGPGQTTGLGGQAQSSFGVEPNISEW